MIFIKCKRCSNTNPIYFYKGSKGYYCRRCIAFSGETVKEEMDETIVDSSYYLNFSLSLRQKEIAEQLVCLLKSGQSVLLEAVCGAGKTELVYQAISYYLSMGKKVGFAISRRQVVIELQQRLQQDFKNLKVIAVCQGYNRIIKGDLIVCTTHQLYRYTKYFDLLIIDEPDGYPYKDNDLLQNIAANSVKGQIVYLTATTDERLLNMVKSEKISYLYLPKRPTGKPLAVPKVIYCGRLMMYVLLIYYCYALKGTPIIIFVPTIKMSHQLASMLSLCFSTVTINSQTNDKQQLLNRFKQGKYQICVATTVLERGITIKPVSVIVLHCQHRVFDKASLIQISGRVGRDVNDDRGKCLFFSLERTKKIDECLKEIQRANNS
ncbi:MAG: helicase-related protein [Erysipelotrichaceae bacterium]